MSNIFTYFTVNLSFSSRDVSTAISNLLQMTTAIIKTRLQKDTTLTDRTRLEIENIMDFVLNTTYFTFRNTVYQQKFGTAVGSQCPHHC